MACKVATVFSDNMVLQRDAPILVWGWDDPGTRVQVEAAGGHASAVAGPDGRWMARLPAVKAGGPFEMTVRGSSESRFYNVMAGEVWLCSGQSNMEWPVSLANDPDGEIRNANYPGIRLLTVPRITAENPQPDMQGARWNICAPDEVRNFSAVGYFFGREIHRRLGVPVGLVNASWGGTVAEAWTSREGLLAEPSVKRLVEDYDRDLPRLEELRAAWQQEMDALEEKTRDAANLGWARGWADLPVPPGDWKGMEIPSTWQSMGLNISGVLWFRKEVEIPSDWVGKPLHLSIGACDKSDTTYFNNVRVGGVTMQERPDAWSFQRVYAVPGELVRAGRNVIAVRVHSNMFAGGMTGPAAVMRISCPMSAGAGSIPLAGEWLYAVERNFGVVAIPPAPPGPGNPNSPSALYCSMIAPLVPYALRGAIWYQGESNADRARQYRTLFPALIRDWRRLWNQGVPSTGSGQAFAFLFVQLANYMAVRDTPGESPWAELREAQAMALRLPQTGMAVAIDIGDAADVHPRNKQEVGRRLALNALASVYGDPGVTPCGPLFRSARREGATLRIAFEHAAGGLACHGPRLTGFAIAGADRRFVWADARIDGETVVVSSPSLPAPAAVRYGWADNPECNLYNAAGLPASPFRTDDWSPADPPVDGGTAA